MKQLRRRYPRTFPFAVGTLGAVGGWLSGVALTRTPNVWGLVIIGLFCLVGMVVCAREVRDARRRLKALQLVQQAIATADEDLLEVAYLQMKYLSSPSRRRRKDRV